MDYKLNIEARSRNNCCCGKAVSINIMSVYFVALVIQHAKRMRRIDICVLSRSTVFFHIISLTTIFSGKSY